MNGAVSKTVVVRQGHRGFESHPLRLTVELPETDARRSAARVCYLHGIAAGDAPSGRGQRLQAFQRPLDHPEAALPERPLAHIDAGLLQDAQWAVGTAGPQDLEVTRDEGGSLLSVLLVERQDQELPKAVGVDVEGRVVEVRDRQPLGAEIVAEIERSLRTAGAESPGTGPIDPRLRPRPARGRELPSRRWRRRPGARSWRSCRRSGGRAAPGALRAPGRPTADDRSAASRRKSRPSLPGARWGPESARYGETPGSNGRRGRVRAPGWPRRAAGPGSSGERRE